MEIRYSREMNHNYMINRSAGGRNGLCGTDAVGECHRRAFEVPGPPDGGGERILL